MKFKIPGILFLLSIILVATSCLKDDDAEELKAREKKLLEQYLENNNITTEPTESGLYYIETEEGDGPGPEINDYLLLKFTGKLVNGNIFASSDEKTAKDNNFFREDIIYGPAKLQLNEVTVQGLYEGLGLMKEGGKATLIIPSEIGYGGSSFTNVPAYSTLIYELELVSVFSYPVLFENEQIIKYLDTIPDITVADSTETGLYVIKDLITENDSVATDSVVRVHYTAYLIDGRQFDTSVGSDPISFTIGGQGIIQGFNDGVSHMRKGEKARIIVPYHQGYGVEGQGKVPGYSTLLFDVELLE